MPIWRTSKPTSSPDAGETLVVDEAADAAATAGGGDTAGNSGAASNADATYFAAAAATDPDPAAGSESSGPGSASWEEVEQRRRALMLQDLGGPPLPPNWVRYSVTGINVVTACVAMATAKQLLSPALMFRGGGPSPAAGEPGPSGAAAAASAGEKLPEWMRRRYGMGAGGGGVPSGAGIVRGIVRDSGVLLGASGTWYGVQWALRSLRDTDDSTNTAIAGAASAALLGTRLFPSAPPSSPSAHAPGAAGAAGPIPIPAPAAAVRVAARAGIWAAVGAWMGAAAWDERQRVQALLLKRQQELEQRHLHTPPSQVKRELDREFFIRLLRFEERAHSARVQQQVSQRASGGGGGEAAGSSVGTSGSSSSSGGLPPDEHTAWRELIESPPWLVGDINSSSGANGAFGSGGGGGRGG